MTDTYERTYAPFEPAPPENAVVLTPTPYGPWLNHPFQALGNDPDYDGRTVYAMDDRPFAMAGLYERWEPPEPETTQTGLGAFGGGAGEGGDSDADGEPIETFTVITTEPNDLVADLHHRMAVILDPDQEETWLRGDADEAAALLDPYPADEMTAYPVSARVNSPGVDAPELIEPVG